MQSKEFFKLLSKKTVLKRRGFFFVADVLMIALSMYISFWLRFNGDIPSAYTKSLPYFILLSLGAKLFFLVVYNLYDISWRFVGLQEIFRLFKALILSSFSLGMILFLLRFSALFEKNAAFPRSVLFIDTFVALILIGSSRISKRILIEGFKGPFRLKGERTRVLIIGAGSAGEQIVREMMRNTNSNYLPVGFIDDDPAKQGVKIHGIKVLGKREDIPKIVKKDLIEEILIALPSASSKNIREILHFIRKSKITEKVKILPGGRDLMDGRITLSDIHNVQLEDLLGRAPVKIDMKAIKDFIQEKNVMITGAGGSIGSELAKSVIRFNPRKLMVLDIDETEIFYLFNDLKHSKTEVIPIVGDIKDEIKMTSVFESHLPQIVVHSAAYKHVPILEFYPEEAVKTNILGTKILAELSLEHSTEMFVFISTDKAINPTSVMGATKRASEELLKVFNSENKTKFISVRFGNVLGSRGSVIPLFKEQIKKGSAVTVTHPEMKRYFMVTSEAVLLILEASAIGRGGEVYILDMGEPIKILDIAKEMIRLSGYEPDKDIPIVFTDVRPGEKLFEEVICAEEGTEKTKYEKILKAVGSGINDPDALMEKINLVIDMSFQNNKRDEIIKILEEIVPSFTQSNFKQLTDFW